MTLAISKDLLLINGAAFLRSLTVGLTGVVAGVYLSRIGLSPFKIGIVMGFGLAGAAASSVVVTLRADRLGRRRTLMTLSFLTAIGGLGLALQPSLPILLFLVFVGMLNGMGTDRSASFALEQAIVPGLVANQRRTWTLAWYNVILDVGGSLGALAAALPMLLQYGFGLSLSSAYRSLFLGYAFISVLVGFLYLQLSPTVEVLSGQSALTQHVSPATRKVVSKLSALFSLDALGGGLLSDALIAYWFFRRFGMTEGSLGVLFFTVRLLNAASHLGAAWLARRIGLIKTMVFTHLPSSIFLILVPFAPSFRVAVILFLLREAMVEMDVPTRQSYVAAVVRPGERTFASGVTNLVRNISWAIGVSFAGLFMQSVALSAPLAIGGGIKISYDLLLYRSFYKIHPPEEGSTRILEAEPHLEDTRN
jgi:MFS family permease